MPADSVGLLHLGGPKFRPDLLFPLSEPHPDLLFPHLLLGITVLASRSIQNGAGCLFQGSGSDVQRVVYCIDASGSMIRSLPMVLEHLGRSMAQPHHLSGFRSFFKTTAVPMPNGLCLATVDRSVRSFGGCTTRLCSWTIQSCVLGTPPETRCDFLAQ